MPKKDTKTKVILICVIATLVVISAGLSVYFIYSNAHKMVYQRNFTKGRNFSFNNETLDQVTSMMNNNDSQAVLSYCNQGTNFFYCRYYCMRINSANSICDQLPKSNFNFTRMMPR